MNWLNRYAPRRAPEDGTGAAASAAPAADVGAAAVTSDAPAASDAAPAAPAADVSADASAAPAADAAPAETKSAPSLLETAESKPKSDAKADDKGTDAPAPTDAAKTEEGKDAKPEGDKKPEEKATEAKTEEAAKDDPAQDATAEQPPAPIKYEAFKVPDGFQLDDKRLGKYTEILGALHVPQDEVQKLIDIHVADEAQAHEAMAAEQRRVWDKLNDTWKSELRADKELGGNRLETNLSMAKAVIEEYGGSPDQVAELLAHTSNNGMGNYPGFVRLLSNIGKSLNVFEEKMVPANTSAQKPAKTAGNRGWYDQSNNKPNGAAAS